LAEAARESVRLFRTPGALVVALLAAATCASASAAVPPITNAAVRTVVLRVHHSHFSVSELNVQRGQKVRFVVRNTDPIDHELIVGPMPVQLRHEAGTERRHPPRPGEVSVPLLSTASTTYTFDEAGTFWFACHLPGHWKYGMQGKIEVR
jgi:uncharacterized cupredoxin-like copper-binding protein